MGRAGEKIASWAFEVREIERFPQPLSFFKIFLRSFFYHLPTLGTPHLPTLGTLPYLF